MSSLVEEGLRHHNAGDLEKAEQCYLDAVAENSSDAQALKLLAVIQAERREFDDALSYAEAASNLLPDDGECAHLLGRIRIEKGEYKAAVPVLRQATQKTGADAVSIWVDFGLCLEMTAAWTEAKTAFNRVLEKAPNHRIAMLGVGRVAQALGDLDDAEGFFKRAAEADKSDPEAWIGLAKVEQQRGNVDAAVKHADHACTLAPGREDIESARANIQSSGDQKVQ